MMSNHSRTYAKAIVISAVILLIFSFPLEVYIGSSGLKYLEVSEGSQTSPFNLQDIIPLGDLNEDGYDDIALTYPTRNTNGIDSGSVAIFWGRGSGFRDLDVVNADLVINGDPHSLFGKSLAPWDYSGNGWKDIVIGAPNADNGSGVVYIFNSIDVNGASSGAVFSTGWAELELTRPGSHFFGSHIEVGRMNEDEKEDMMVLSQGDMSSDPEAVLYSQGASPIVEYNVDLKTGSVNNRTRTVDLDMFGSGWNSLVYSSPDRGEVNIIQIYGNSTNETRYLTGAGQLGRYLEIADADDDGSNDLVVSSPQDGKIRIFRGNEPYWLTLPAINHYMANHTIEGPSGSDFGYCMNPLPPSPFTEGAALLVSEPSAAAEENGTGLLYTFDLPMGPSTLTISDARYLDKAPSGIRSLGFEMVNISDRDNNDYPEVMLFGWNGSGRLVYIRADRSPFPPELDIISPRRHAEVSGKIEMRVRVTDVDGDVGPEDIRFYRSSDNRSWVPIGDGEPDRIEGDIGIKDWNTTLFENAGYFFKFTATDDFGLTSVLYTDRVDVMNHAPPFVDLNYPRDGAEIRGNQDISARISVPSDEELDLPVRFFYSMDNESWVEFGNTSSSSGAGGLDYVVVLDTEKLRDGEIWFMVNATTVYGLGREDRNVGPVVINNLYAPVVNISSPIANTTVQGIVNVTAKVTDPDDDLKEPVVFNIKRADKQLYDPVSNMTYGGNDTYYYVWDTTTVVNGAYDLMVWAEDRTFMSTNGIMNASIYVDNEYAPTISLTGVSPGDVLSGLYTFTAVVSDRDLNFRVRNIVFEYSRSGEDIWTSMDRPVFNDPTAQVTWDTSSVMNGLYDIRATVTDDDNLTGVSRVDGVKVKNPHQAVIIADLPDSSVPLSGVVGLNFKVSDDEPLPPGSIKVEIRVQGTWRELEGLERTTTGGTFTPWKNISFYIEWDTTEVDDEGQRVYPDSFRYDVRITVTDSDNLTSEFVSSNSYLVDNRGEIDDDDDVASGLAVPGWAMALIIMGAILLFVLIFLFLIIWGGRKKEKDVPLFDTSKMPGAKEGAEEEEGEAPPSAEELYSPGGWGAPSAEPEQAPTEEEIHEEPEVEEDLSELTRTFFGAEEEPKVAPEPAPRPDLDLDVEVEVDLPEGVMPSISEEEEEWEDVEEDEWEEEEEEFEEVEELEDMDEEEWGDLEEDEDEWEDVEEDEWEEEDIITVSCKCGEEIEIPSDFKGSKYRCPECGRKGRIPGR
ncbi:MAG: hypothetical protein R6V01_01880 [Thermoplasmatota archaeon]